MHCLLIRAGAVVLPSRLSAESLSRASTVRALVVVSFRGL